MNIPSLTGAYYEPLGPVSPNVPVTFRAQNSNDIKNTNQYIWRCQLMDLSYYLQKFWNLDKQLCGPLEYRDFRETDP